MAEVKKGKEKKSLLIGVVDDHIQTAVSISTQLEYEGFKTFQVYSGNDAIERSKKDNPDLLIVDVNVNRGGPNGYQVAEALPKQKILFTCAGCELDTKKSLKLKNVLGLITKPVNTNELLEIIKKEFKI